MTSNVFVVVDGVVVGVVFLCKDSFVEESIIAMSRTYML
jgi:hypothetical protein